MGWPQLIVYDTDWQCLRNADCKDFSSICSNSKFVFGVWQTSVRPDVFGPYRRYDTPDSDDVKQERYSRRRIQVHDLNTLREAFGLRVPKKYTIKRIMADEHHLVAMSRLESERPCQWAMSIFDLQASGNENGDETKKARFLSAERHVELGMGSMRLSVFLHCEWLVFPHEKELVWFDKKGNRSVTSTHVDLNNVRDIYSSGSSLLFALHNNKLLFIQWRDTYKAIHYVHILIF